MTTLIRRLFGNKEMPKTKFPTKQKFIPITEVESLVKISWAVKPERFSNNHDTMEHIATQQTEELAKPVKLEETITQTAVEEESFMKTKKIPLFTKYSLAFDYPIENEPELKIEENDGKEISESYHFSCDKKEKIENLEPEIPTTRHKVHQTSQPSINTEEKSATNTIKKQVPIKSTFNKRGKPFKLAHSLYG